MYKKLLSSRGAVAVFLIIILVPMITISSMFVEVARIQLAKSVVSSAGDLALNTLLTKFDTNLNDYYGMLASAQDTSDVMGALEDYFKASLVSQGIDTTFLSKYVNSLSGLFVKDESIDDLLKISLDEGSFKVEPAPNGALSNPAIIKTQIVDFMKFRSPANAAKELLDMLFDINDNTETIEQQTQCAQEQQTFYNTEEELLREAKNAYDKINEFLKDGYTDSILKAYDERMNNLKEEYKHMHYKFVYDLAGTGDYENNKFEVYTSDDLTKYDKDITSYTLAWIITGGASASQIGSLMNRVAGDIASVVTSGQKLINFYNAHKTCNSTDHKTRFYIEIRKNLETDVEGSCYKNYKDYLMGLLRDQYVLKKAYESRKENAEAENYNLNNYKEVNTRGTKTIANHYTALNDQIASLLDKENDAVISFYALGNLMTNLEVSVYNASSPVEKDDGTQAGYGSIKRSQASSFVQARATELDGYIKNLELACKELAEINTSLDKVRDLIDKYNTDYNTWKGTATNEILDGNAFAEESREDIKEREKEGYGMKGLNKESVDALQKRINNIDELLSDYKRQIETIKYGSKSIKDITTTAIFEEASTVSSSEISIVKTAISSYADSTFEYKDRTAMVTLQDNHSNSPEIKTKATPELYTWMSKKFTTEGSDGYTESDADAYKNSETLSKKVSAPKGEAGKDCEDDKELSGLTDNLSTTAGGNYAKTTDLTEITNTIKTIFGDLPAALKKAATTVRDDLYSVDYIMSMFSYDTYNLEGKLELWADANPDSNMTIDCYKEDAHVAELWKSEKLTDTYNKSLTNKMINKKNCYSFGNEVEYILFGKGNSTNKTSARALIYIIRLAMDMGPVFSKYFSKDPLISALSAALSAATVGVVPEVVFRFAICLGMAIAEAGIDLAYIENGIGVPLLKSKDQIFVSFDGLSNAFGCDTTGKELTGNTGLYLQYSDYLKIFLFLNLLGDKADSIYLRTANVIQANMTDISGEKCLFKNSQVYYNLSADIHVDPIMFGIPLVQDEIDSDTADGVASLEGTGWNTFHYSVTRGY